MKMSLNPSLIPVDILTSYFLTGYSPNEPNITVSSNLVICVYGLF